MNQSKTVTSSFVELRINGIGDRHNDTFWVADFPNEKDAIVWVGVYGDREAVYFVRPVVKVWRI